MTNKYNVKKTQTYNIQKKRQDKKKIEEVKKITKNKIPYCAIDDESDCYDCDYQYMPYITNCNIWALFKDYPELKDFFKNKKGDE